LRQNCNHAPMNRRTMTMIVLLLSACLALAAHADASPTAFAAGCSIPHQGEHLGPTYLTSLSVSGTSCSSGLAVVSAYHACQLKHGGVKGKCSSTVDGFRCAEKRGPAIPTEFFSSVSCQDGSKRVSYKYSQFT
jgi:hypothetical protein